jgi:polysaccharide deacetylase 2 family uncharacterized protein YibQ
LAPQPAPPPATVVAVSPVVRAPKPLHAFARPFDKSDRRPRVALVLSNEADRSAAQMTAATKLPGVVTLAFTPYTRDLPLWVERARQGGHEILLGLPMEPLDPGTRDAGPLALLADAEPQANAARLDRVLESASSYVGVLPLGGGRLLGSAESLRPILAEIDRRGLLLVDPSGAVAQTAGDLPRVGVDRRLEGDTRAEIERRLADLEDIARRAGGAVGLAPALPAVIERIAAWTAGLEARGIALAPITAMLPE